MAIIGVPAITANGIPEDASRPFPNRDPLLDGAANSGVRFLFDLAFPDCYPGGSQIGRPVAGNPANGAVVQDMTNLANGSVGVGTAAGMTYSGGGFDFTNSASAAALNYGVNAPASALADLVTPFGGKVQRFLLCAYMKLPSLANWNNVAAITSMIGEKPYQTAPSLLTIGQSQTNGRLEVRRQTAANAYDVTAGNTLQVASADTGIVVQVAVWRNDAGQGFRLRSPNGTNLSTRAVGADNTQDFSADQMCFGRPALVFAGASGTAVNPAFSGVRIYRGFIENLARSGRDPATVLDADYTRVTARAVFS